MEKHINLARKLKALADRGVDGEKLNGEKMLADLMAKHKITLADIEGEKQNDYFFKLSKDKQYLWHQIVGSTNYTIKVYGEFPAAKIKELRLDGNYMITCTVVEFAEITAKFDFYSKLYDQELTVFFEAFIHANDLLVTKPDTPHFKHLTEKERSDYSRARQMASQIKKGTYYRQIERVMALKKETRIDVHNKYGNRCGYCGEPILFASMQVDHIIPQSNFDTHIVNKWQIPQFLTHLTIHDVNHIDNLMPTCRVCNKWKDSNRLEFFREEITQQIKRCQNYSSNYRMAIKYKLIQETPKPVVFWFETYNPNPQ